MPPVIRFAAFKHKSSVTPAEKQQAADGLKHMYEANAHRLNYGPRGSPDSSGKGFEFGFLAQFKVGLLLISDETAILVRT